MLCSEYGWSIDYCLNQIPASQFFAFYKQAIKIRARHYSVMTDLSLMPKMDFDYYRSQKEHFLNIIYPTETGLPDEPEPPQFDAVIPLESTDAKDLFFSVFASAGGVH